MQYPSDFHPVRRKDRLLQRRNYVLREMWQNGYLPEDQYLAERDMPLLSVQNGDFESFKASLPPRDYFTDEIRRQLSRHFGEDEFFSGGMTVRATIDPEMQGVAAVALQRALETYDRAQGVWRGTGQKIDTDLIGDDVALRAALRAVKVPRNIDLDGKWHPAVVTLIGNSAARIVIEDVPDDEDGHFILREDVRWARKKKEDGTLGLEAKVAGDLLELGDVVLVREIKDAEGNFERWSLRQVSEVQGAFMAMDVNSGRVLAMQGGFDYSNSVYNRATQAERQPGSSFKPFVYAAALDSGYSPATIVVDAPIEIDTPQGLWRFKPVMGQNWNIPPLCKHRCTRDMIAMRMGIDDPRYRFVRQFLKLCKYIFGGLGAFAGVDDCNAAVTLNHMNVGRGIAHSGINAIAQTRD